MFLKQPNRRLQQLFAVENKTILQQPKPSTFYIMFQLTPIFYPHHTGMRSQMLYTNGSFEICQERMLVKQRRTHGWSTYLLSKKILKIFKKKNKKKIYIYIEMLSWPHRTSANIINICFWLLETCTKCSYFIQENIRPGAQRLAFEVRVYRTPATSIPWAGGLYLGKFPDNRRLM